jgi:hypothetical protein
MWLSPVEVPVVGDSVVTMVLVVQALVDIGQALREKTLAVGQPLSRNST